MANGVLASVALPATDYTSIYGPSANTFAVVTVSIVNKNTTPIQVRLALASNPSIPTAGDYIEYNAEILPGGVLERTGVVIQSGRTIYAYSTQAQTDVVVYGIVTATA
jgi:ABC-type molybdate transport system substrate-binding protein